MVAHSVELGKKAALLSMIEVGVGSLLHGLRVPLAGHLLSLNQGFVLTWALRQHPHPTTAGLISTTAALLKSLSPAGKKLTPMLAIALQGQLFGCGYIIGGQGVFGHFLGMLLLCLWGFIQPLMLYYFLYGDTLVNVAQFYINQFNGIFSVSLETLFFFLVALLMLKLALGLALVLLAHRINEEHFGRYTRWALGQKKPPMKRPLPKNPYTAALRDLSTWPFLLSWGLTLIFFFYSQHEKASSLWIWLRPLALGYLLFLVLRLIPLIWIETKILPRYPALAQTLKNARHFMRHY